MVIVAYSQVLKYGSSLSLSTEWTHKETGRQTHRGILYHYKEGNAGSYDNLTVQSDHCANKPGLERQILQSSTHGISKQF